MQTAVARRFKKSTFTLVAMYFVIYFACFGAHFWLHLAGVWVWVLAILPVLPMVGVIAMMGRYLRDETDEYKRDVTIRCVLWGTAGAVSASMLGGFLWIFGWKGHMLPFCDFYVFALFMMVAKLTYKYKDQALAEEHD
jgi:hypothetical protein